MEKQKKWEKQKKCLKTSMTVVFAWFPALSASYSWEKD